MSLLAVMHWYPIQEIELRQQFTETSSYRRKAKQNLETDLQLLERFPELKSLSVIGDHSLGGFCDVGGDHTVEYDLIAPPSVGAWKTVTGLTERQTLKVVGVPITPEDVDSLRSLPCLTSVKFERTEIDADIFEKPWAAGDQFPSQEAEPLPWWVVELKIDVEPDSQGVQMAD